jgi:hypothetical protein
MPGVEAVAEPDDLRRYIRDLVALSTLPTGWADYGPGQIGDSVAAALSFPPECRLRLSLAYPRAVRPFDLSKRDGKGLRLILEAHGGHPWSAPIRAAAQSCVSPSPPI